MTLSSTAPLRVVLVDFDWQDADFMLRLVGQPALSIRLVAGEDHENPGIRLAQISGLPRSTDLGDLTREIFDLALISPRSQRRDQVEALMNALGTPIRSPSQFIGGLEGEETSEAPAPASPLLEARDQAVEGALSAEHPVASLLAPPSAIAEPLPDVAPAFVEPSAAGGTDPRAAIMARAADDRDALEHALTTLAEHTGADHAELRMGTPESLETVARIGMPDLLGETLVDLALRQGSEQVVRRLDEGGRDRVSGAWPLRTARRLGVLCVSGVAPDRPWEVWRDLAAQLYADWQERDQPAVSTPAPEAKDVWQHPEEFRRSLERALERNRTDDARFSLHRYRFACRRPILDELCELLPRHLRGQDLLCRPLPQTLLLLTSGPPDAFFRVNQRIFQLWEGCWRMSADADSDPRLDMDSVELHSPDGGLDFVATAAEWLGATP